MKDLRKTGSRCLAALTLFSAACGSELPGLEPAATVPLLIAADGGTTEPRMPTTEAGDATPVLGCDRAQLLERSDTAQRGPWAVGTRTVSIGRLSSVEVLYPAKAGSEVGQVALQYDLRTFLPQSEQSKVPDDEATLVSANTFRGLPLDEAHGPYPAIVFVHGTGSYRVASLSSLAMWASRGFIVLAADHPGVYLADQLAANGCGRLAPPADIGGDINAEIAALRSPAGALAFLAGRVDPQRLGLIGHSSGAVEVARIAGASGAQAVVTLAGPSPMDTSRTLRSALFIGGMSDQVMPYTPGGFGVGSVLYPGSVTGAFQSTGSLSPLTKRLVGIRDAGHLNLTDMCQPNLRGQSSIDAALAHGVCGVDSIASLANCGDVERQSALDIVNVTTALAFEEVLHCRDRGEAIASLPSQYPGIGEYLQQP